MSGIVLDDPAYARANPADVERALARLGCRGAAASSLAELYRRYAGPFTSEHSGFELLDLVDQAKNVLSQTDETGAVYEVDFEGGDAALQAGTLAPTWTSFDDFLASYFGGGGGAGRS